MAGLSDSAAVIALRIKSDSSDAQADFKKFKKELNEIDREAKASGTALDKLGAMSGLSAQQFDNLKAGALAAVAGIGAVVSVAAAAAVGIFNLSKATADFGSELFDAQAKTGLSAETLSTLKLNADKAGASFDQVTMVVGKFSVLLGKAQQDNVKAQETLAKYGVTATDTKTALDQAITTIAAMETVELRAAAASELLGDRKRVMLPIIEQLNGSLSEATKETIRTGQAMTDKGIRAADEFGDALVDLNAQAAATGRQFALELMPQITGAMKSISEAMANNAGVARQWGTVLGDAARGTGMYFSALQNGMNVALTGINRAFGTNLQAAVTWSNAIFAMLGPTFGLLAKLGASARPIGADMGGSVNIIDMPTMPSGGGSGGGGGGKGGGKDPKDEAEKRRKDAVDAARKEMEDTLAEYAAGYKLREAELAASLSRGEILEIEGVRDKARIRLEAVMDEKRLNEQLLANDKIKLNDEERAEILLKLKILTIELRTEKLRGGTEINAQVKKEIDANDKKIEQLKEEIELERKRANERAKRQANQNQEDRNERKRELEGRTQGATLDGGGFSGGLLGAIGIMGDATLNARDKAAAAANGIKASWESMGSVVMGGIDQMVQGLGSMVEAWVLYGSAGPNAMKKMVASVLAGVAAQSAVLAIFELAKGFAALWFNPAEAAAHFKSAALFGSIAVGAALGGRAIAGDSFSQSTANGGAGGGANNTQGDGSPQRDPNSFSSGQFGGFGTNGNQQNSGVIGRLNETLVVLEDTVHGLKTRIAAFSPGQVLGMGAEQNPNAISDSLLNGLSDNPRLTGGFKRAFGDAR